MIRFMKCGGWVLFTMTGVLFITFLGLKISNSIHPFVPEAIILKLGVFKPGICCFESPGSGIFDQAIIASGIALFAAIMGLASPYLLEEAQQKYAAENEKAASEDRNLASACALASVIAWSAFFYAEVLMDAITAGDGGQLIGLLRYFILDQPPQRL